ncbi:MAG: division/cell wall cluster transcriptional repressor MraZ [Chitinophagales bacterium]|nr:division/cell wall cluster transcriptional repressor MraZ [Chitinophagales bacterium]MDW8418830.1 division/cell wall cluster transcriptional repressor MraZ [Chitinophagales bacterium]
MAFRGQYECTMDDKGRIKMPAALRKQFPEGENSFIIVKDTEDCLVIYPMREWEAEEKRLMELDNYDPELKQFITARMASLTEVEFDSADRFVIGKRLAGYLGNSKNVVLVGWFNRIQLWDAARLEQYQANSMARIKELATKASEYLKSKKGESEHKG